MIFVVQLAKMAALAAVVGMVAARWTGELTAATVGAGALYLLLVRVS